MRDEAAPKRRFGRRLAVAAVVGGGAAVGILVATPPAIGFFLKRELRAAGFTSLSLGHVGLGWGRVSIDHMALGGTMLDDVSATFGLGDLLSGRIGRLTIGRALVNASVENGRLVLSGYNPPTDAPAAHLPLDEIALTQGEVRLGTPWGDATAALRSGLLSVNGEKLAFHADLNAAADEGSLTAFASGSYDMANAALTADLAISNGDVAFKGARFSGLGGRVALSSLSPLSADVALAAGESTWHGTRIGPFTLTGAWQGDRFEAALHTQSGASAQIDLGTRGTFDVATLAGRGRASGEITFLPDAGPAGRLRLDGALASRPEGDTRTLEGHVALEGSRLRLPGLFSEGSAVLKVEVGGTLRALGLALEAPFNGRAVPAAGLLPPALAAYDGKPLAFDVAAPAVLTLDLPGKRAMAPVHIDLAAGETTMTVDGEITAAPGRVAINGFSLSARQLSWEALRFTTLTFKGSTRAAGTGDWALIGEGAAAADGRFSLATIGDGRLSWSGRLAATGGKIAFRPDRCLSLSFGRLAWGAFSVEGMTPPCLSAREEGEPLFTFDEGSGALALAMKAAVSPFDITLKGGDTRHVTGQWPEMTLVARHDGGGLQQLDIDASGAALTDTADGIAVSGVALKTGLEGGLSAELSLGAIESLARPALFAPLTLDATTKGGAFDASLSDKRGLFVFEAKGDMSTQGGKADLTLYPVTFLSGATEVADVSPCLALLLSGVTGTVGFKGHAGWGKDGLESEGTLSMSDLGGSYGSIVAAGIDGDIAFSSLFPLATKGPQTVTVAAIAAGLPLSDGRIVIEEKAGKNLTVGPVDFNMAGGTLHADPFMADLTGGGDTRFVVDAENVDLNQVIAYADIDGLTGTGTLSGRIPVKFGANGFSVDGGGLAAIRQGELHYRPAVLPGFLRGDDLRAQMLRDVLQNFQYSNLSVGLTGGTGGEAEQEVKLSAKGGNPDFLDGHPVELNVTFKGALLDALMSAADITGASALERLYKAQGGQQQEGSKTQ